MFKNYFRTAIRSLWRQKGFSILNISGLAIGMTAFFFVFQYVRFEMSYDSFHTKGHRIYRLVTDLKSTAATLYWPSTSMPMAINLKKDYPEVESVVRISGRGTLVSKGNITFQENNTVFADSTIFGIFDFSMVEGDARTALKEPFSVVLSQSMAKKYFGNADPIGQTILLMDSGYHARITGVIRDIPENSSIKADLFVAMSTLNRFRDSMDYRWGNFAVESYLLLKPGADAHGLQAKLGPFIHRHWGQVLKAQQEDYVLSLEKLNDVYWSSRGGSGSRSNIYIFSIVGIFILLIACINFVNLTTARSTERAKEVGVRKVVGAAKLHLMGQFLGESILISLVAFVLSLSLCGLLLPLFNQLTGKTISTGIFSQSGQIFTLLFISLAIGFLAGVYPALVLSSFNPISSLKGRFSSSRRGLVLRRSLVVVQFTISITLIIGTIVIYSELNYMRSRDLGFKKDQLLVVNTHNDGHKVAFRQELMSLPDIQSISFTGSVPGNGTYNAYSKVENSKGEMQVADLDLTYVDFGYLEQYNMRLLAGRFFSKYIATDTMQAMILNEKAVQLFGYASPQAAIGRKFSQWGKQGVIIGVIKDYNFNGLQKEITPLSICLDFSDCNYLTLKVGTRHLQETIAAVRTRWEKLVPSRPFDYFFLDESFDRQYRNEERFGNLFINFAVFAIFISCLGLLGLASYSTIQRTKEVGVRRVMGASIAGIVRLLSVDFLKLVLMAFLAAVPLAWYFMDKWLQDFAYRTPLGWWIFASAGIAAGVIAFLTISYQAIRAAVASPVKSLRSE